MQIANRAKIMLETKQSWNTNTTNLGSYSNFAIYIFLRFDVYRLSIDQLTSEVNQLNQSLQKIESQLDDAADDVKDQLQDFLKVGKT